MRWNASICFKMCFESFAQSKQSIYRATKRNISIFSNFILCSIEYQIFDYTTARWITVSQFSKTSTKKWNRITSVSTSTTIIKNDFLSLTLVQWRCKSWMIYYFAMKADDQIRLIRMMSKRLRRQNQRSYIRHADYCERMISKIPKSQMTISDTAKRSRRW